MARTNADAIKEILDTDLSDVEIEAFIAGATEVVSEVLGSSSISGDLKEEIERWLTAHMIASTREQQLSEAKADPVSAKFQGKTGLGLDGTMYGQTVKILDTTGSFAALGGKGVSIVAVRSFDE